MTKTLEDFEFELKDFVMEWVVAYQGKYRKTSNINGFCRTKLAKIFCKSCSAMSEDQIEEVALYIDEIIPQLYAAFAKKRCIPLDTDKQRQLIFRFKEDAKEVKIPPNLIKFQFKDKNVDWYECYLAGLELDGKK